MQVASNNPLSRAVVRVLIFGVIGITLSAIFVKGGISVTQAITTIAIFAALNVAYELVARRTRS